MAITTSIRMPDDVHEQFEMLARATGRTRNELMVEALSEMADRRLREIAMIQEGLDQANAGLLTPLEDVVERFKAEGMLSADFQLDDDPEQQRS
jgi:predicted transcriptional regulator